MSDAKSLKFNLLEGEYFTGMVVHDGKLWLQTNLGTLFQSTDVPSENIDFIEVEQ